MAHLKSISRTHLIKKFSLAFAACGLIFPGASVAQPEALSAALSSKHSSAESSAVSRAVLSDGNYLFGQSPARDELGMTYAVLSVKSNQTIGAFYQPRSSFDCFSGQMSANELSVNIVNSYDQTVYPYEIAVSLDNSVVAGNAAGGYILDGFYRIDELSNQDQEMLAVCQADFAE